MNSIKLTKVVPIDRTCDLTDENDNQDVERSCEFNPVYHEKLEMMKRAEKRFQDFKKIIYNQQEERIPYYVSFYGIAGILFGVFINLFTTLIQMNDPIRNSSDDIALMPVICSRMIGFIMIVSYILMLFMYWTNTRCIAAFKYFGLSIVLYLLVMLPMIFIIAFGIWTKFFGFQLPLPFQQLILGLISAFGISMMICIIVPKQRRKASEFRKGNPFFVLGILFQHIALYGYTGLGLLFASVPNEYQWVVAITLPIAREICILIQEKLAHKSAGGNDTAITIAVTHGVNVRHCVFLSVMVGTLATNLSSWIILLTDFIFNLYLALKIIWIKKTKPRNGRNDQEMIHLLVSLTINELVEVVIPLTFLLCFLTAYYGPNAEIIGGVKSSHFHHKPVANIYGFVKNMMLFVIVDIFSVIFLGMILWTFCKINLAQAYMTMLKEFWPIITMTTGFLLYTVIILKIFSIF